MTNSTRAPWGAILFFGIMFLLGLYFAFAAVRGEYGVFRRAEVEAQTRALRAELDSLNTRVARMDNLTHRLSDSYLDLDLLDERARDVLGMVRSDEIVVR